MRIQSSIQTSKIDVRIELMVQKISSLYIATQNKNHKSYQNCTTYFIILRRYHQRGGVVTRLIILHDIFYHNTCVRISYIWLVTYTISTVPLIQFNFQPE